MEGVVPQLLSTSELWSLRSCLWPAGQVRLPIPGAPFTKIICVSDRCRSGCGHLCNMDVPARRLLYLICRPVLLLSRSLYLCCGSSLSRKHLKIICSCEDWLHAERAAALQCCNTSASTQRGTIFTARIGEGTFCVLSRQRSSASYTHDGPKRR